MSVIEARGYLFGVYSMDPCGVLPVVMAEIGGEHSCHWGKMSGS